MPARDWRGASDQSLLLETPERKTETKSGTEAQLTCKTGRKYNTVYLSTFSRLLTDNIYSGEKVDTKTRVLCSAFLHGPSTFKPKQRIL